MARNDFQTRPKICPVNGYLGMMSQVTMVTVQTGEPQELAQEKCSEGGWSQETFKTAGSGGQEGFALAVVSVSLEGGPSTVASTDNCDEAVGET